MVAVWGYAYGVSSMYRVGPYSSMAFHTAVSIVVLSLLGLLAVRQGTLQWISFGRDPGAVLQRILIPLAVVLLPVPGLAGGAGSGPGGYFDLAFASALLVSFMALLTIAVGLIAGITAMRTDRERDQLVDELHHVNQELEDRVRSRSLQVNRQRTKLALLEERDRIARDLHDRVIQRIFAAGLQVGSMSRTARKLVGPDGAPDPRLPEGLNSVATELDMAIRELRNSIFELTSIADHDDIEQVVRDVVARASRILGFMPKISVSGEVAGLDADLVAHIASVLQEALSNVARHARASEVEVVVRRRRARGRGAGHRRRHRDARPAAAQQRGQQPAQPGPDARGRGHLDAPHRRRHRDDLAGPPRPGGGRLTSPGRSTTRSAPASAGSSTGSVRGSGPRSPARRASHSAGGHRLVQCRAGRRYDAQPPPCSWKGPSGPT